ncbi:hypothetical protein [Microcoleus asticus]|uniref:hypothetical protein n=1 Tax=Microcoleus asticus TaxID=2815231 RepID=UPI0015560EEA|nr:hypothetical protein [Microcoleus asticus]
MAVTFVHYYTVARWRKVRSNSANNHHLGHCFGQKNVLTEILTKISSRSHLQPKPWGVLYGDSGL